MASQGRLFFHFRVHLKVICFPISDGQDLPERERWDGHYCVAQETGHPDGKITNMTVKATFHISLIYFLQRIRLYLPQIASQIMVLDLYHSFPRFQSASQSLVLDLYHSFPMFQSASQILVLDLYHSFSCVSECLSESGTGFVSQHGSCFRSSVNHWRRRYTSGGNDLGTQKWIRSALRLWPRDVLGWVRTSIKNAFTI